MSDTAKISKVIVDLGKKEIELTTEQAEKLYDALHRMFGQRVIERVVERDRYVPYYPWRWGYGHHIYCSNGINGGNSSSLASGDFKAEYRAANETLCLSAK